MRRLASRPVSRLVQALLLVGLLGAGAGLPGCGEDSAATPTTDSATGSEGLQFDVPEPDSAADALVDVDVPDSALTDAAADDADSAQTDAAEADTAGTDAGSKETTPYDVALLDFAMTGTEPPVGSTLAGPPFAFTMVFSTPLKKESVSKVTISVIDTAGGEVPGKWSVDSNKATFTTTALVAPASRMQADVSFLVQSYQGVTLPEPKKLVFYTAPPTGTEPYAQMALRYAPVLRQAVTSPADYLRKANLDGDWQGNNNQVQQALHPKLAEVTWSAVETQSHVFLGYVLFWPERPAIGSAADFANDTAAVLIAVRKARPGVPERPVALHTFFRSKTDEQSWLYMVENEGLPKGGVYVRKVMSLDALFPKTDDGLGCEGLQGCETRRVQLWQTAANHQICLQGDGGQPGDGQCFLGAESMKNATWLNYLPATAPAEAPAATAQGAAAVYTLRSILETWWPRRDEAAPDGLWQDTQFVYEPPAGRPKGDGLSLGSKFVTALNQADINALDAGRPPWSMRWKPGTQSQTYYELPRGTPWLDPAYTLLQRLGGQNAVPAWDPATAQGLSLETCWNAFLGLDQRTSPACAWTAVPPP